MNVKPGDLAIVIDAMRKENISKIVLVERYVKIGDEFYGYLAGRDGWVVNCDSSLAGSVNNRNAVVETKFGLFPDSCLRPVSGLPLQEDENIDIKEPA